MNFLDLIKWSVDMSPCGSYWSRGVAEVYKAAPSARLIVSIRTMQSCSIPWVHFYQHIQPCSDLFKFLKWMMLSCYEVRVSAQELAACEPGSGSTKTKKGTSIFAIKAFYYLIASIL